MNILITGANGMLAQDLLPILEANQHKFFPMNKTELDILNKNDINTKLDPLNLDILINCAAYTKVDLAESEKDQAFAVNYEAVKNLVDYCKEKDIIFVHISTDYVFDGTNTSPYTETDTTNPISVYGESKLKGEEYIHNNLSRYFILRTSWLYGNTGKNFVKTMIYLGENKDTFNVVNDQLGSPTYTEELSQAIVNLIQTENFGLYHFSGEGQCSWYDFACTIIEIAKENNPNIKVKDIKPIPTTEYPTPAKRPLYSVFSKDKYKQATHKEIPHWKDSLKKYFEKNK